LKAILYIFTFSIAILLAYALKNRIKKVSPTGSQFIIPGGQFDMDVKVIITEDTAYALKYVKENLDSTAKSEDFNSRGTTFTSIGGKSPIIWMPNTNDISIINHELLHVTINIMAWAGVPLTEDTEEVYAYELQYLSKHFYDHINK
jgi:hypothetical protein